MPGNMGGGWRQSLFPLCILGEGSKDCTSFIDVNRIGQAVLVNTTSGTPCVRCLNPEGRPLRDVEFHFGMVRISNLDGHREEGGVMIMDNSTTFLPDASVTRDINCVSGFNGYSFELISTGKYWCIWLWTMIILPVPPP
jgi:hypothetical protein